MKPYNGVKPFVFTQEIWVQHVTEKAVHTNDGYKNMADMYWKLGHV